MTNWQCDKSEACLQLIVSKPKKKKTLTGISVGDIVQNRRFAQSIDSQFLSESVSGVVIAMWETLDSAYAAIRSGETTYVVCLG